jgi:formin 2
MMAPSTEVSTKQDSKKLLDYKGPREALTSAEQFLIKLWLEQPFIFPRLKCLWFKAQFYVDFSDVMDKIAMMRDAATIVTKSQAFQKFLLVVLEVGNLLNYGTLKGSALGFSLDSLRLLESCKGYDEGKTSLLKFVLKHLQREDPGSLAFINDFEVCKPASALSLSELESSLDKFNSNFNDLEEVLDVLKDKEEPCLQVFKTEMKSFKDEARLKLDELTEFYRDMERKLVTCGVVYVEDPFKAEDFFKFLRTFAVTCNDILE